MVRAVVFCEDMGHEQVVCPLVRRVAGDLAVEVSITVRSAQGGAGRALFALERYMRDIDQGCEARPDLLVVAVDANCFGRSKRRQQVQGCLAGTEVATAMAIPDPHVERWLLVDGKAFKSVLGVGCKAPDQKCEKDRYKEQLRTAVREAGVEPLLGGLEHAEAIVAALDLQYAAANDTSLEHFIRDLRAGLQP